MNNDDAPSFDAKQQECVVGKHPRFDFSGPGGNPALVDLSIVTREGATPVVIAHERDDNPGISITNGAEQLAAQVLMRVVLHGAADGTDVPFRLVVHNRATVFEVGDRDFDALESTFHEVRFADFSLREGGKRGEADRRRR
jgi:hypothetical protein